MQTRRIKIALVVGVVIALLTVTGVIEDGTGYVPPHNLSLSPMAPPIGLWSSTQTDGLPTPAVNAHELGVSDNLAHLTTRALNTQLATLKAVGVTWLRKDLEWRGAERVQGTYNWSTNDATVAAISHAGIKPLLIFDYAPDWAAGSGQTACAYIRCSPANTPAAIAAKKKRINSEFGSNNLSDDRFFGSFPR